MTRMRSGAGDAVGDAPEPLPYCAYPRVGDVGRHGLLPMPARLPRARLAETRGFRSRHYRPAPLADLPKEAVLETAEVVAASFALREPQCRHLRPPREPRGSLYGATHADEFGQGTFGPWTRESLMYWFIRLFVLTDPTSPRSSVRASRESLEQSLAIADERGRVIGGAFNETMPPVGCHPALRTDDPFIEAVLSYIGPVLEMLSEQDAEAVGALRERYPEFRRAHEAGRVGHHFMVARSDLLAKEDTFELVAGSVERYHDLGFEYMLVEATNQWTGAACEALGGVRVHYRPFLGRPVVPATGAPLAGTVSSANGCLAAKDSGSMFYVIRII